MPLSNPITCAPKLLFEYSPWNLNLQEFEGLLSKCMFLGRILVTPERNNEKQGNK